MPRVDDFPDIPRLITRFDLVCEGCGHSRMLVLGGGWYLCVAECLSREIDAFGRETAG